MKLLEEQYVELTNKLEQLKRKYASVLEQKKSDFVHSNFSQDGFSDISSGYGAADVEKVLREIRDLEKILATCVIVNKSESDVIEVGSEFTATIVFDGEEETNKFFLSETAEPVKGFSVISTKSPLGMSVLGKKKDDTFGYQVNGNQITGVINDVHNQKAKTIVK